jgi:hypothetical protein
MSRGTLDTARAASERGARLLQGCEPPFFVTFLRHVFWSRPFVTSLVTRGEKMRIALIFFLLASPAFAQSKEALAATVFACGSTDVKFDVKEGQPAQPASEPEAGKALVYVVEDMGPAADECLGGCVTVRVGLDGDWVGANQGNSHFSFLVSPGEHHLCSNWQSRFASRSSFYSLANFNAEAGKIYYFRTRVWGGDKIPWLDLDRMNSDQGRYMVVASAVVTSHVKK